MRFLVYRLPAGFTIVTTVCFLFAVLFTTGCAHQPERAVETPFDTLRAASLEDIFVLRDYTAGKNSFVENAERHVGAWTGPGFRYTLLDVEGSGSVRHIWTTRGGGEPYFDWEFYVDGEETPSVKGTDVELIHAAGQYAVPLAPANSVPLNNRDYNLFLPIPFGKSIRIDVVQRVPNFWLWFCQIDYRLDDDSLNGVRAYSDGAGEDFTINYAGLPHQQLQRRGAMKPLTTDTFNEVPLRPGEMLAFWQLQGPAVIREFTLKWQEDAKLRLLVRYDGEDSYAINAPLDRFFGPYQGASLYSHDKTEASCYLPLPFRKNCDVLIVNEGDEITHLSGEANIEYLPVFDEGWGYLHALHQQTEETNGHRLHQVLYTRGNGHWLGMSLFNTGHDHGGGDFAVINGIGNNPKFLHGVNGEDYFTFAWFGKGAHHPYAVAHTNEEGRYRHHFENVYPFKESIAIEWGAYGGISPESVAYWYQDSPEDLTVPDGALAESTEWDVFGPVPIPLNRRGESRGDLFSVLPPVKDLDDGKEFECRLIDEHFLSGWMKEWSTGPSLNLTYIGRHGTDIKYEAELGGMGHAYLARRFVEKDQAGTETIRFAHDDPIQVWLNGKMVYEGGQFFNGYEAVEFKADFKPGKNEIVVKLTNYFNRNFNWAGFWMKL